ncbi:MAG: FeoB-associated Cys-rich membrane protein [Clostridiales bacterium]|nr:FeoB-associated Cys-rich membrane protein [Clostridia bacterium]MCR4883642.1 FeoB-associated Cys-rich membrane protein [Clostridiales bacterium]
MLEWFNNNWGTLLVGIVLLAVVCLSIRNLWKDKKQGKSSCGCGCGSCPMHGTCHKAV